MSKPLIENKKNNIFRQTLILFFSGSFFLILNFLITNKKVLIASLYEELMVYNLGFSSLGNLVDKSGEGSEFISTKSKFNAFLKHIIKYPFIKKGASSKEIPILEISIPYEELNEIYNDRLNAISKRFLSDPKWVNAEINYKGKQISAKTRLKGLLPPHWEADKRFSLRFKLKNKGSKKKNYILGMDSFSLHKLRARQYPYEYIFHEILPEIGLTPVKHKIVNVIFNGVNWGYMDIQEHISTTMLEKNKLKDSLVIDFNDSKHQFDYKKTQDNAYSNDIYWLSNPRLFIEISGKSKSNLTPQERRNFSYILNILQDENYKEILFNKSQLKNALEISKIWGNFHAIGFGNSKFYFNPFTLKLEPIMSDQGPFKTFNNEFDNLKQASNGILNSEFVGNNPKIRSRILKILNEKSPYYLSEELFPFDQILNITIPKLNYNYLQKKEIQDPHKFRREISNYEKELICNSQRYDLNTNFDAIRANFNDSNLIIHNLICGEILIKEIKLCDQIIDLNYFIDEDKYVINEPKKINLNNLINKSDYSNISDCNKNNYIRYSHNKTEKISKLNNIGNMNKKDNPLIKQKLNNEITSLSSKKYLIKKGYYQFTEPVIILGDLDIEGGSIIKFSENAYLIVKGNINFKGNKKEPILMSNLINNKYWKGIYVYNEDINKKDKSTISYLQVENIKELDDHLLDLSGGINFYNLNLTINNLYIRNSIAEDALNIIKSNISLNNTKISNTKSDAFDCDFCEGFIDNLEFSNVGGDGLDISGSKMKANIKSADGIKDKVVSVGEKSYLNLKLNNISNSYVGVAVKDASQADIKMSFVNTTGPKIMSYNKKSFYDGLTRVNINYEYDLIEKDDFLASYETEMFLNNKNVKNVFIDVEKMYEMGPMKK